MTTRTIASLVLVSLLINSLMRLPAAEPAMSQPNIVVILADDLGYGDVTCYNSESKVATPHLDQLAREGMRFTDAHSASTVCTPSRYSLMTGRMCFRTGYRGGVFSGVGGPSLIEPARLTLPAMLKQRGYATACVGKWHIGMSFQTADGKLAHELKIDAANGAAREVERVKLVDFSLPITDGPVHRGFDYFFGTACCPTTDWLYAYIENDRVPIPPDRLLDADRLPRHPYAFDCRRGWLAPGFDHELADMVFLEKSQAWIEQHVRCSPDKPFFLYHAMQAVHLPSFAAPAFQGTTPAGPHGDFIAELDHVVGQLVSTLQKLGVADNTLIIFSSDNGPETTSVAHMRADFQHDGARPWRGVKRDQWEGGHRVPFIAKWPGKVPAGSTCNQTICLTDVMATCAAITGFSLPHNAAEDSFDLLPWLLGKEHTAPIRPYTLHQTISLAYAIRKGPWKYLNHRGSGGNNYHNHPELKLYELPDSAPDAPGQLYNLESDPGERMNVYFQQPEIVEELKTLLERSQAEGRSAANR